MNRNGKGKTMKSDALIRTATAARELATRLGLEARQAEEATRIAKDKARRAKARLKLAKRETKKLRLAAKEVKRRSTDARALAQKAAAKAALLEKKLEKKLQRSRKKNAPSHAAKSQSRVTHKRAQAKTHSAKATPVVAKPRSKVDPRVTTLRVPAPEADQLVAAGWQEKIEVPRDLESEPATKPPQVPVSAPKSSGAGS
jgi:hypothetical protein